MSKPSFSRSANGLDNVLNNSSTNSPHRRSMPILFKRSRLAKKQQSLLLNRADFELCQVPNENEMHEFMSCSSTEENNHTNQSDSTTSDDTITDRQQQSLTMDNTSRTTTHKHYNIPQLKQRPGSYRFDHSKRNEIDQEKNQGFLLVDQLDADLVLISNENIDPQNTRHAEPCAHGQIDDDIVDINQVHLESTTPVTPRLLPPAPTSVPTSILPLVNHSNSDSDIQATQAGVECETPNFQELNIQDTQMSTTDSSSSTNSSNNDSFPNHIDRNILNDNEYILEQKRDHERITIYEIALNNDRRDYLQDLPQNENDEADFNHQYKETIQLNLKLKEELKRLQEEKSRIYASWACKVCTYINEPYIRTKKNVCEMCEGPSPLKQHTLTS